MKATLGILPDRTSDIAALKFGLDRKSITFAGGLKHRRIAGKTVGYRTEDSTIKRWDIAGKDALRVFQDDQATVALAPSKDQASLICASAMGIKLLRADSLQEISFVPGGSWVLSVAVNRARSRASSAHADGSVGVWELHGPLQGQAGGHSAPVSALAMSPDGLIAISGRDDHVVRIWDAVGGRMTGVYQGHVDRVRALAISADQKRVASGGEDRTVKVWTLSERARAQTLMGHGGAVTAVAFTPDGRQLVSGSADGGLKIWDLASGREVRSLRSRERILCLDVTSTGRHVASGSAAGEVKFWDISSGIELGTLIPFIDGEWLFSTPAGKVDCSPKGGEPAFWRVETMEGESDQPFAAHESSHRALGLAEQTLKSLWA